MGENTREKQRYTALDLITFIEEMEESIGKAYEVLEEKFSCTTDCTGCHFCKTFADDTVHVPDWAKLEAGYSADAKFFFAVMSDTKQIVLEPAEHTHDLGDISENMQQRLADFGICLGELNESLMKDEVIYEE
ncbi:hypothetical protein [Chakrabartyella piscis]|uniref:hypothetical protein n=1 Tax=Chakrabartyella piscis TaxID=2918914 RepID=UPI00295863DE|nr:hypothetical protein [Chakrabartyella piscis]